MVKLTKLFLAATIAVLFGIIGHPLWLATTNTIPGMEWFYWGMGLGLIACAGGLHMIGKYDFLQYLFGCIGAVWAILFFFECFPAFSISLV